jgi:probable HAF family extracellular repeat protein
MTRSHFLIATIACSLATSSIATAAEVRYRLTHIVGGSPIAQLQAGDMNRKGEVVGSITDFPNDHAFLWNGQFVDLHARIDAASSSTFARGNNNRSDIAGNSVDAAGNVHGFLLLRGSKLVPVEVFAGSPIAISDVNNRRQVTGTVTDTSGVKHGFVWQRSEAMLFDPLPVHRGRLSVAEINDRGVVVGTSGQQFEEFDSEQAVIWKDGETIPIAPGTVGPDDEPANSQGIAINNRGQAIGELSGLFSAEGYSFVWQDGQLTQLPTLDGGNPAANEVFDINNRGAIVGWSSHAGSGGALTAVLWQDGSIVDLNERVDASDPLREFVTLRFGVAINDRGEIVAQGHDSRAGQFHFDLYLLTPVR